MKPARWHAVQSCHGVRSEVADAQNVMNPADPEPLRNRHLLPNFFAVHNQGLAAGTRHRHRQAGKVHMAENRAMGAAAGPQRFGCKARAACAESLKMEALPAGVLSQELRRMAVYQTEDSYFNVVFEGELIERVDEGAIEGMHAANDVERPGKQHQNVHRSPSHRMQGCLGARIRHAGPNRCLSAASGAYYKQGGGT